MKNIEEQIAGLLLQSKSIKLQPTNPFTWASGWKSPIYCDNRKTLSFPEIRTYIKNCFVDLIKTKYPEVQVIAGVATGAIAQAALIAEVLNLPLIYIRPQAKKHGLGNQIEGSLQEKAKVVVIEDLISTGNSSLNAVDAIRNQNAQVLGMLAVFTYGFQVAKTNFEKNGCEITTLSNYETLIKMAVKSGFIKNEDLDILYMWRKDPENWNI